MRQFACLSLALFIVLLIACSGAVIIGRAGPPPKIVPGLAMCGNAPCFHGIVPDQTSVVDAQKILAAAHELTFARDAGGSAWEYQGDDYLVTIFGPPNGKVSTVQIYALNDFESLATSGQLFTVLGVPKLFSLRYSLQVTYIRVGFFAYASSPHRKLYVTPDLPIHLIELITPSDFQRTLDIQCAPCKPWKSFGGNIVQEP